jgi:hypothetical protein
VHLALVDPFRATPRRGVAVRTADGSTFVSPGQRADQPGWDVAAGRSRPASRQPATCGTRAGRTFRGRDVFSPVAARLAHGLPSSRSAPALEVDELERLAQRLPTVEEDHVHGEVAQVDHFGNLTLNLQRTHLEQAGISLGDEVELRCSGKTVVVPFLETYGRRPRAARRLRGLLPHGHHRGQPGQRGAGCGPAAASRWSSRALAPARPGRSCCRRSRTSSPAADGGRPVSPARRLAPCPPRRARHRCQPLPRQPARGRARADPSIERVIGVDTVPPAPEQKRCSGRTEFVRADIRNPLIAKVIAQAEVDTVVHMNVIATPLGAGGRTAMKEINVIGTMQLLAACQKAPSMRKLVVKSTTAVYGSRPRDPALFTESSSRARCRSPATPRTPSRSRGTSAASAGAVPT